MLVALNMFLTKTLMAQTSGSSSKTNKNSLKMSFKEDIGFGDRKTLLKGKNAVSITDEKEQDPMKPSPSRTGARRMVLDSAKSRLGNTTHGQVRLASSSRQGRTRRLGMPNLEAPSQRTTRVSIRPRQKNP